MNGLLLLVVFPALWGSLSASPVLKYKEESSLRLVHVLFRHGNRNPDESSLLPDNLYLNESYYPEGFGQLTNAGKRTEYKIGLSLRKRYNNFLTDTWNINYLESRTTNVNRTKMSLELLLAGLYPPKKDQQWSELPWQPIPYNYYPTTEDKETQAWSACSAKFYPLLYAALATPEALEYLSRYDELFEILQNKSGSTVSLYSAFGYYFGFATQEELGYPLQDWVSSIYPEPIHSAAVDLYYFFTNTTALRRITAGFLLKKILLDTKSKIDGTISPSTRKVFLYSAHELNVASAILSLDAYKLTDIPAYGAHVIYEVHEIDDVWGLKLFYQDYTQGDPIPVKIPGCDYFCSYDDFSSLVEEIIPESEDECF